MKIELAHRLFAKYPALFSLKDSPRYPVGVKSKFYEGIDCRDGWYDLLDRTFAAIQHAVKAGAPQPAVQQVSQKFGRLKLSVGFVENEEIRKIKRDAEHDSLSICEFCGQPGSLTDGCGLVVACSEHRSEGAKDIDPKTVFRDMSR